MKYIDMHCDSVMLAKFLDKEHSLYSSENLMVDFKKMQKGEAMAQCFAVFMPSEDTWGRFGVDKMDDDDYISRARQIILDNVAAHGDIINMAYSADDIVANDRAGKMSAILTMEDGRAVQGKLENLKRYYDMGFRALSLTWNYHNCFGAPNSKDPAVMAQGLTDFGKEAVEYMQELGIAIDVSHLSRGGFWDVAKICKKPFIATHSNAYELSPHQRNLKDEQIKALAAAGGVTGLNFCPQFLQPDTVSNVSTAELLAKHARHIADVGGVDVVGIGSDFDGIEGKLEISDASKMQMLADALLKEKFTYDEIEKIFYKNVLRALGDII